MTAAIWARFVHQRLAPFLKQEFPGRTSFRILLDGEELFHAPEAKAAYGEHGITCLPNWPADSPDMNPQENVWPWAEKEVRRMETDGESFETFVNNALTALHRFPGADKLVGSMAKRIRKVISGGGAIIDQ